MSKIKDRIFLEIGMESGVVYSEDPKSGEIRLQLRDGLNRTAFEEITKGEYDCLWLYYGNFEAMTSVQLEKIKGKIWFQSSESQDVSWISGLSSIESLSLKGKIKGKINFSEMKSLRFCEIDWCAATKNIIYAGLFLESLGISRFSGSLDDFCWETCKSLLVLGLTGSIETLNGIRRFEVLESLSLWNMKKLTDISDLPNCRNLKSLHVENCNQVEYKEVLKKIATLEEIFFENSELYSTEYLPKNWLKKIILGSQTKLVDGDVESFLSFPKLKMVSFPKKKGYRYSSEEMNEIFSKREKN